MTCLFCNIAQGKIPATIVHTDDKIMAFRDVAPQAPTHILIIPKKHIPTINALQPEDSPLIAHMIQTAKDIATKEGLTESGYRLVFNVNADGGQTVYHIHLHLLGGRHFTWPPG